MLFFEYKKIKKVYVSLILAFVVEVLTIAWSQNQTVFAVSTINPITQIGISASLFNNENKVIENGTYEIRFALYTTNRDKLDMYPSNADAGARLWEETQQVSVKSGLIKAFLGSVNPFPENLNFETGDYYIGIRIGTDSEMVPRKKLGSVPSAVNSQFLQGKRIGIGEGNIALLGKGGKIDIKSLPIGTGNNQLVLGNDSRLQASGNSHTQNTDTGTSSKIFNIGSSTSFSGSDFDFTISNAAIAPTLRYNGTSGLWQLSNDGTTFSNISTSTSDVFLPLSGGTMVGDILFSGSQTFANLINLGADTIGNYVASISAGNGISGSSSTEGGTPTLSVDLLSAIDGTGVISSNSGLEFSGASSNQLSLLQGCTNGQGLSFNTTTKVWECTSFSTGLAGTGTAGYATYWNGANSLGSEAQLAPLRGGTGVDGSSASNGSLLIGNGSGYSLATLTGSNGLNISNGIGSILLSLDVATTGTTATTSSNSGLELTADGLRLISGCINDQVLAWNTSLAMWVF